jgi:hypothetical protein
VVKTAAKSGFAALYGFGVVDLGAGDLFFVLDVLLEDVAFAGLAAGMTAAV